MTTLPYTDDPDWVGFWEFTAGSLVSTTDNAALLVTGTFAGLPRAPNFNNDRIESFTGSLDGNVGIDAFIGGGDFTFGALLTGFDPGNSGVVGNAVIGFAYNSFADYAVGNMSASTYILRTRIQITGVDGAFSDSPDGDTNGRVGTTHLTITRSGNTFKKYVDGVYVSGGDITSAAFSGVATQFGAYLPNKNISGGSSPLMETVDNLFCYKGALTDAQIALIASGAIPTSPPGTPVDIFGVGDGVTFADTSVGVLSATSSTEVDMIGDGDGVTFGDGSSGTITIPPVSHDVLPSAVCILL